MIGKFWFVVVFLAVILLGCEPRKVEIQMNPKGDSVERRITATNFSDEDLSRIAKAYPKPTTKPTTKPAKNYFVGTFKNRTPQDIGGAGWYLHYSSQMGQAFGYSERFCGNDDLNADLQKIQKAADALTDHLIGWFQAELGQDPNFPKLKKFMDKNFRQDIKNLALYYVMGEVAASYAKDEKEREKLSAEFIIRYLQYLAERDYFDPQRLPKLVATFLSLENQSNDHPMFHLIQQIVARKMGYPAGSPSPSFAFLEDTFQAEKSFTKYLSSTKEYHDLLAKWEEGKKTQKDLPEPDPWQVMRNDVLDQLAASLCWGPGADVLKLTLHCATQPYQTNGQWQARENAVVWSQQVEKDIAHLPTICYAFWSTPDECFQKTHFGKVFLTAETLAAYCLWRNGLTPARAKQWDQFLANLHPGSQLPQQLRVFRFSDDPTPNPGTTTQPASQAKATIDLLLEKLNPPTAQPTTRPKQRP